MRQKEIQFKDLCSLWLEYKAISVKPSTYAEYERIITKKILPKFGNIQCNEIEMNIILQFIIDMKKNSDLSSKSVLDITIILKSVLKYANELELMRIPLDLIPLPKVETNEVKTLHNDDVVKLVDYISKNTKPCYLGILLSIYTGMRIGEVCALQWKDIDFEQKYINITKTMQRVKIGDQSQVIISAPKTRTSIRKVPFQHELYDLLKKQQKARHCYVVTGSERIIEPRLLQMHFKRVLHKLDIEDINFHALRHTFATRCIQCNVDIKSLSEILGHSSVNTTLNKYVHSSLEIKYHQINKLSYY